MRKHLKQYLLRNHLSSNIALPFVAFPFPIIPRFARFSNPVSLSEIQKNIVFGSCPSTVHLELHNDLLVISRRSMLRSIFCWDIRGRVAWLYALFATFATYNKNTTILWFLTNKREKSAWIGPQVRNGIRVVKHLQIRRRSSVLYVVYCPFLTNTSTAVFHISIFELLLRVQKSNWPESMEIRRFWSFICPKRAIMGTVRTRPTLKCSGRQKPTRMCNLYEIYLPDSCQVVLRLSRSWHVKVSTERGEYGLGRAAECWQLLHVSGDAALATSSHGSFENRARGNWIWSWSSSWSARRLRDAEQATPIHEWLLECGWWLWAGVPLNFSVLNTWGIHASKLRLERQGPFLQDQ